MNKTNINKHKQTFVTVLVQSLLTNFNLLAEPDLCYTKVSGLPRGEPLKALNAAAGTGLNVFTHMVVKEKSWVIKYG